MKTPLTELITGIHDEIQKARIYISEFSNENELSFNLGDVEVNIPACFEIDKRKMNVSELEKIQEKFLEIEIPHNFKKSIRKENLEASKILGTRILCEINQNKFKVNGHIKLSFRLEIK